MIDQFQPWYFGIAFAFLFKYCTGMPDMPAFAKRSRYRRKADAPRIEINAWVQAMSRRVTGPMGVAKNLPRLLWLEMLETDDDFG